MQSYHDIGRPVVSTVTESLSRHRPSPGKQGRPRVASQYSALDPLPDLVGLTWLPEQARRVGRSSHRRQ